MAELNLNDFLDFCKVRSLDAATDSKHNGCSLEDLFESKFNPTENRKTVVADSDDDYDEFVGYDGLFADVVTS